MSFSFEDFLLYTKAPEADIKLFSILAPGVLTQVEDTYGIILSPVTKDVKYFLKASGTTFELPLAPVNEVTKVVHDGVEQVFTFYGNDIVTATSLSDIRKPVIVTANLGYTEVPADLKLAVYQHIESLYFRAKNSSDNIEKVVNSSGNTTFFREDSTPKESRDIYNKYSNRVIAYY